MPSLTYKGGVGMTKRYITIEDITVYAIYYRNTRTIYYNLNFDENETKVILIR